MYLRIQKGNEKKKQKKKNFLTKNYFFYTKKNSKRKNQRKKKRIDFFIFFYSSSPKEFNLYHPHGNKNSIHSAYWGKDGDEEDFITHCWPLQKFIEHAGNLHTNLVRLDMDGAESVLLAPIREWINGLERKPSLLFTVDR